MRAVSPTDEPDERMWNDLFDFLEPPDPPVTRGATPHGRSGPVKVPYAQTREYRVSSRYEEILCKLTAYFDSRSCADAENCAMETIKRVAIKCRDVTLHDGAEPMSYFYGCARNVLHEVYRDWQQERTALHKQRYLPPPDPPHVREIRAECLEECMKARLHKRDRELILEYYRGERGAKIEHRKKLAASLNKALNALRIETHRIRKRLRPCVTECMERRADGVTFP